MANLRLKKLILEIVDNQLRDNNPPVTRESYEKLLAAGYSVQEAKEKIGTVVIEEIYDVLKENQVYDEEKYSEALERMVQQCIDYEDVHIILTEWDEWDEADLYNDVFDGYVLPPCRKNEHLHCHSTPKDRNENDLTFSEHSL